MMGSEDTRGMDGCMSQTATHVQGLRTHVQDNSAVSRFLGSFSSVYFGWLRPA